MSKLITQKKGQLFNVRKYRGDNNNTSYKYLNNFSNKKISLNDLEGNLTNFESTSSFKYQKSVNAISTQQINLNYNNFENHTFFHSAVAKTNEIFSNIINNYPFDGTLKQIENFEEGLTGFEKHILDKFPKKTGHLIFSGTQKGEYTGGNYIDIQDKYGVDIPDLAKDKSKIGKSVIEKSSIKDFTIQFFINSPGQSNDNQVIFQKYNSLASNVSIVLSQSLSSETANLIVGITSQSLNLSANIDITKNKFNHITTVYENTTGLLKILNRVSGSSKDIISSSSNKQVFPLLTLGNANVTIGSGSECRISGDIFTPQQTFSGSLDEFRYFNSVKKDEDILKERNKSVYANDNLMLYLKFNEPYGNYTGNNIVLDSSGNSLNAYIENFNYEVNRNSGSFTPMLNEDEKRSVAIFPEFFDVNKIYTELIVTGTLYDDANPNLITKLIPKHYLDEGNLADNFISEYDQISNYYTNNKDPRGGKSKEVGVQNLMKFLFIWAKFFDEIKIFVDEFSNLSNIQYDDKDTVSDIFIKRLATKLGIDLPELFDYANLNQYFFGEDISENEIKSALSLSQIQNKIWRRVLSDYSSLIKSKGTMSNIKGLFRYFGIEPDSFFSIVEYGGAKENYLETAKINKKRSIRFLNFSGSIGNEDKTSGYDYQGRHYSAPVIISKYLSASRIEIGIPEIAGSFVQKNKYSPHGISNHAADGLFTSGSFTYECFYDIRKSKFSKNIESLVRLHTTGSSAPSNKESCILNVVYDKKEKSIKLLINDVYGEETKILSISDISLTNSGPFALSFGKEQKPVSSSFFLRVAEYDSDVVIRRHVTSSLIENKSNSIFSTISNYNTSGSFIVIGSQSFENASSFLNADATGSITNFTGMISNLNFWSIAKSSDEFTTYAKNPFSKGIKNPKVNYNFNTISTGSFERIRIETSDKQKTESSDSSGEIKIFDFSQNNLHLTGKGFETNKKVFKNDFIFTSELNPYFDTNHSDEKIRIRSLNNVDKVSEYQFASTTPVYEVNPTEKIVDDNRLSIDFNLSRGINENIIQMFSDFSAIEDSIGKTNVQFGNEYHSLKDLREIYFNNVIEKINLNKYRNLFKWIDNSFTDLIYSNIPKSTNFLGINFIYDSHFLERNKIQYNFDQIYLKSLPRDPTRGTIYLSQFVGKVDKI